MRFSIILNEPVRRISGAPHVDQFLLFAAVVFLNPDEQCDGGTNLYRHRETKIDSLPLKKSMIRSAVLPEDSSHVYELYKGFKINSHIRENVLPTFSKRPKTKSADGEYLSDDEVGLIYDHLVHPYMGKPPQYFSGDLPDWEVLFHCEMKFNRLFAYPTWQLHAPDYQPEWFQQTRRGHRLTHNLFVYWPEKLSMDKSR